MISPGRSIDAFGMSPPRTSARRRLGSPAVASEATVLHSRRTVAEAGGIQTDEPALGHAMSATPGRRRAVWPVFRSRRRHRGPSVLEPLDPSRSSSAGAVGVASKTHEFLTGTPPPPPTARETPDTRHRGGERRAAGEESAEPGALEVLHFFLAVGVPFRVASSRSAPRGTVPVIEASAGGHHSAPPGRLGASFF